MSNVKAAAQQILDHLPDDITWEDLMSRLYVREKIEIGLQQMEAVELAKEVVTDFSAYGLASPLRRYTLLTARTNAAGVPTNQILAQLDFGTREKDRIYARRHDETSVYIVPRGSPRLAACAS